MQPGVHSPGISDTLPFPVIPITAYSSIPRSLRSHIDPAKRYRILVASKLSEDNHQDATVLGDQILKNPVKYFSNWLDGYGIYEEGRLKPVFIYRGSVSQSVIEIMYQ